MKGFPYVPMEVVERSQYDGGTYFLIQTREDRNGWEVAEVRPDIPWQLKVAQLLASAPDLLEALELADAALSGANMNMNVVERKVKAAIARARGEQ